MKCQNLALVDEADVTNESYSQNIILQPLKEMLLSQKDISHNGKPVKDLTPKELTEMALAEAKEKYLRLRDDWSLQQYDIL